MLKRILSLILALLFIFTGAPVFSLENVNAIDEIPQMNAALPESATLVGSVHLPPIGNQGAVGCCASMAATYLQFTNAYSRYLHAVDPNTDFNPSSGAAKYNFSPRFTYNLAGSGTAWVYEVLKEQGTVLQTYSVFSGGVTGYASDNALANDWATINGYWTEAMQYRISNYDQVWMSDYNFQLTTTNSGKALLARIKTAIHNGNVVVTGGYPDRWDYTTVTNGGTYGKAGQQVIYRSTNRSSGGHQVAIVGYDDNLTCTVNGVTLKGAFLVANSWGTTWKNNGYTWVMYDAVNQSSAYSALNHTNRQWTLDQFVFLDWQTDLCIERPALMAKVEITTADRNGFSVTLTRTDASGNTESYTPYIVRNENLMPKYNSGLNFYGKNGSATGYLTYNYGPLLDLPTGTDYNDYVWGITVATDSGKSVNVGKVELLNAAAAVLYTHNEAKTLSSGASSDYLFSDLCIVKTKAPEGTVIHTVAGTSLCPKETLYSFTVTANTGYTADSLTVTANGTELYPLDGVYTLIVNQNTDIRITGIVPTSHADFDITWYGTGFENYSGKFILLPMIHNKYLDPNIYASAAQLSSGNYPYFFRITVNGITYRFTPHSFYHFDNSTLYRLAVVDGGWIPKNGTTYSLKIEFCTETEVLYSTTENVTCKADIAQSYTAHTHNFHSGVYTGIRLADCCSKGTYDEYCSYNGCLAVISRESAVNPDRHTARYSQTVIPTIYEEGSYTVYCSHCHTVLHTETLARVFPKHYDLDNSGTINISDVNEMLICLSTMDDIHTENELFMYDVDENGVINISDLNTLLTYLATI